MTDEIKIDAYAKINLTLDVLKKREDGYHEVKMIMQTVEHTDKITILKTPEPGIKIDVNLPYIPVNRNNSAFLAAEKFFEAAGIENAGVLININKNIPVAAGLAGGSADAAAVLRGLNLMFDAGMSSDDMRKIAQEIGSDVAFCISGGTALATGRGEIIEPLPSAGGFYVVLCTPSFSMSTPYVYKKLSCRKIHMHPDTNGALQAIKNGLDYELASRVYNVLEDGVAAERKCISEIHAALIECGAAGAAMSGSGPTVFGLFKNRSDAENAFETLKRQYERVFLTSFKDRY